MSACRGCVPICRLPGTGWCGAVREPADADASHPRCADTRPSAGSCGCARPASWVCVPISWLLAVGYRGNRRLCTYFVGAAEIRAYLRVPAVAPIRLPGFARLSASCRARSLCRSCGSRRLWAYLIHAAQIRVYLRVPAAVPVRLPGFTRLSPGSCAIGAVPSPGQTAPARAPSPASR